MAVIAVAPGQVWMDNDPRIHLHGRRYVEILSTNGTHALARGFRWASTHGGGTQKVYSKTTRIRLDRFKPTTNGYKRVS